MWGWGVWGWCRGVGWQALAPPHQTLCFPPPTPPHPVLSTPTTQDLILSKGRVRWRRLENLFEEGSKSQDFDPAQLWLLAEWVCSEGGRSVRPPLAAELVRLVDAVVASGAREQLAVRAGAELADRLVPGAPEEEESRQRALLLWRWLSGRGHGSEDGAGAQGKRAAVAAGLPLPQLPAGWGPWGLPGPWELQQYLQALQDRLAEGSPRLRALLDKPGAQELVVEVGWGLANRGAARSIKLLAGLQGAGEEGGQGGSTTREPALR